MLAQYRVSQWGKWRPSAEAKRLGEKAIILERMLERDGYTFSEVEQILTTRENSEFTVQELEALYLRLPQRSERPRFVSPTKSAMAEKREPVELPDELPQAERDRTAAQIGRVLKEYKANLEAEDQAIIRMRFYEGLKGPEIARRLHKEQKKIYKRIDTILSGFRRALAAQQIDAADIESFLARSPAEEGPADSNVRTVKSADSVGIYVDPSTARRTLEELLRGSKNRSD
jgi:hypothetical protein